MTARLPLRALLALIAATVITLSISEFAVRHLAKGLDSETIAHVRLQFRQFDASLGWANRPGAVGTRITSEFTYPVRVNSQGMRGPEIAATRTPGKQRIAVLGDSFTWGLGVREEDSYPSRLGRLIPETEVLNFGVVGYGPVQYLLQIDHVLEFKPDHVIIAICLGNDFADTVLYKRYGFFKPYARLETDGHLKIDGHPLPEARPYPVLYSSPILSKLQDTSYLFRFLERIALNVGGTLLDPAQRGPRFSENQRELYLDDHSGELDRVIEITASVLREIVSRLSKAGIPVTFLAVPTKCELGACFQETRGPTDRALRALRHPLTGLPTKLIVPGPELNLSDFWLHDAHWRPSGHEKVANALAANLHSQDAN